MRDGATGADHVVSARAVVLAAGGFGSVRLAMASDLPDRSGLLGRRLSDHWFVRGYFPLPPEFYDKRGPQAGAAIVRQGDERAYQLEIHLPARRFLRAHDDDTWAPTATEEYAAMVRAFAPIQSQDTSYLELTAPDEPGGYTVHMDVTPADEALTASMRAGLERVRDALGAADAEITVYPFGASFHEAGGLQMGADEGTGVVDPFGQCWGDPRVTVADASAWPTIGCANPHLTLVAMARRQATALADRLGGTP